MDDKKNPTVGAELSSAHQSNPEASIPMNRRAELSSAPTKGTPPLTPLMQQYHSLKSRHMTELLFFRLGDFFELFGEDAQRAAPILEVALTHRQQVPMCGVPAHALEPYVAKLLKAGLRVAIAEQMEDPSTTKTLVKREVVRVITPGTLQEETLLPSKKSNFLAALWVEDNRMGLAALDCSTGEFIATEISGASASTRTWDEVMRLRPSEILVAKSDPPATWIERLKRQAMAVTEVSPMDFSPAMAEEKLNALYGTASLRGFGLEDRPLALRAAGAAARYLETMQCGRPLALKPLRTYSLDDFLQMDANTLDHLDLVSETASPARPRTLLDVLDQTLTPMGGRLLRRWVVSPLRRIASITERQQKIGFFLEGKETRRHLRAMLQGWPDMERILSRLAAGTLAPRDLAHLAQGLRRIPKLKTLLASAQTLATSLGQSLPEELTASHTGFPEESPLAELLDKALVDAPPATLKEGGVIRPGYNAELDEVRSWITEGKTRLLELEKREREQTGIPSLKIGFNNVFGYFIEITKTHLSRVPMNYLRKQTTANGERYITPELKEFETRILGAEERVVRLETALVQSLRDEILRKSTALRTIAAAVAELDVVVSLADIAERKGYVRPVLEDSSVLCIREGRHPVLDDVLPAGTLVPNDTDLDGNENQIVILTGPNMSGKSTYLRQTALITVMAQMGSFVPAAEARIGIIDQLFTRIGASDRLMEGESTFMVEMVETARILNHATPRSLVILDEVGRGTSTYDGISIAWACLEFLHRSAGAPEHRSVGAKVLFATHYFELTGLAETLPGVRNAHVTAKEWGDHVVFLHKVEPGPADRAYGIHVAKLAGVPKTVLNRAAALLKGFELRALSKGAGKSDPQLGLFAAIEPEQPSIAVTENDTLYAAWKEALDAVDVNTLTPVQALIKLQELKDRFPNKD
jgi:DNA mismatch repair protein MutS